MRYSLAGHGRVRLHAASSRRTLRAMTSRSYWPAVWCGFLVLAIGLGVRQSFGIFLKPVSAELHVGREVFSFATAVSLLLMGLMAPFAGRLADRFGSAPTIAGGAAVYCTGMIVTCTMHSGTMLVIGAALCGLAVIMMMLPIWLNDSKEIAADHQRRGGDQTSRAALSEAFAQKSYVLLFLGFFVCGFHVAFVGGHLPAYISDKGVGLSLFGVTLSPAELGGWSIGMVGLFNIAGSIAWSALGSRYQRKNLLSVLYLLRSLVFLGFVLAPLSAASVLAFAAGLGFLWLGTVPLTNALVRTLFGPVHMTMLNGIVFLGHQLGSFLGSWGGGKVFDLQGNYDLMWWIAIALGLVSALLHWPIVEKPVARPSFAAQPA